MGFAYEKLDDPSNSRDAWISASLTPYEFNSAGNEDLKLERYEEAISWFERALLIEPQSAETLLRLGKGYEQLQVLETALKVYRQAWNSDPEIAKF